jgi:hypothetical protein
MAMAACRNAELTWTNSGYRAHQCTAPTMLQNSKSKSSLPAPIELRYQPCTPTADTTDSHVGMQAKVAQFQQCITYPDTIRPTCSIAQSGDKLHQAMVRLIRFPKCGVDLQKRSQTIAHTIADYFHYIAKRLRWSTRTNAYI